VRAPAPYVFISPDGKVYRGENIRRFAAEHGLDPANMHHVALGERLHHKGWTWGEHGTEMGCNQQ